MVVPIADAERFKFGQWLRPRAWFFGLPMGRNMILSRLNDICVNSGAIRRHCGR